MSIQVTACLNPFSGERKEFSFEQGITINEIIRNLDALNAVNTGWRVMIDDEIITDFERVPEEGQRVYIKLVPEGDNNKDSGAGMKIAGGLLTVVGAILAFTPASALGFCLIGCGVGMFTGGVVLYNTDIPSLSDREKPEQDPSIRGSRNQMRPYGKVPVLLGKRRIYADACANPYTWVDSEGAIWLHQLFCVAQKDIQIDTSTLKIDETLLKDYSATGDISRVLDQSNPDPLIQMKISYGDSTPPLYDKCVHEIQLNTVLKHQTEDEQDGSVIRTTPAKTTKINVDVFFYNGLGKYNDDGEVVSTSVELRAEYKKSTDPDSAYQLLGYFSEGSNTISGSELKTKRYAITKDNLAADSYTVKISRVTEDSTDTKIIDTVYVGSIRAANNDTPVRSARCQQVTLIGLKIKASEKLNNIVEQLNFVAQSRMPVYNSQTHQWTNALTSNPASAAMYAMQGEVAQQQLSNSDIDLDSFAVLYDWCEDHDYECNAYITDDMTINDLLSSIASTCRAEILRMNGKITVIQDIAKDSFVQLFTPRNSHDYKETMALADIPDVLKMGIVDKTNGYAENEVPVYNTPSGNPVSGVEPQTSQSVPLWGVTDSVQARKLAMYNYAVSKHRFTVVKFSCDFEYLMCRKGDWIKYAGDIALAGLKQGRIEAVDGQKLILDEQVTMESGSSYAVRIRKSDGTAALCNVQTVVGTSNEITISGQIPSGVEGCLFAFGITGNETLDLIVTDIQCGEDLSADLTCVEYAPEIFGVDDPGFVLPDFVNKLSDTDCVYDDGNVTDDEFFQKSLETMQALISGRYANHIVTLYKYSETDLPSSGIGTTCVYDFSTDTITWGDPSLNNGWSVTVPSDLTDVWVTSATAHGQAQTYTINSNEWARPIKVGQNGVNGLNTCTISLYKRLSSTPQDLPATVTYNFANASMVCSNWNGWSTSIPPIEEEDNDPCWEIHATALSTSTTDTIESNEWSVCAKILSEGLSKQEVLDLIGERINETPNVLFTPSEGMFAVDEDGIVSTPQTAFMDVRVIQNDEDITFNFGQIDLPTGMTVSATVLEQGTRLNFTVAQGTRLERNVIKVPVIFTAYADNDVLVDENGNPLVWVEDEDGRWYGDCSSVASLPVAVSGGFIYWNGIDTTASEELVEGGVFYEGTFYTYNGTKWKESKVKPIGIQTEATSPTNYDIYYTASIVKGGRYDGGITTVASIPSDPVIGDYFTWTGADQTPYEGSGFTKLASGCVYKWNGTAWEKDTSGKHLGTALPDILEVAESELVENNSDVVEKVGKMIAWDVVTQNIKVTGEALINSAIIADLTLGDSSHPNSGSFKSWNYVQGSDGFKLNPDGTAELNDVTIRGTVYASDGSFTGDITANSLTLGSGVTVPTSKVDGINEYVHLGSGYGSQAQAHNTSYFKVSSEGLLEADNAIIHGTIFATNGIFQGTVHASDGEFEGSIINDSFSVQKMPIGSQILLHRAEENNMSYGKITYLFCEIFNLPLIGNEPYNYDVTITGKNVYIYNASKGLSHDIDRFKLKVCTTHHGRPVDWNDEYCLLEVHTTSGNWVTLLDAYDPNSSIPFWESMIVSGKTILAFYDIVNNGAKIKYGLIPYSDPSEQDMMYNDNGFIKISGWNQPWKYFEFDVGTDCKYVYDIIKPWITTGYNVSCLGYYGTSSSSTDKSICVIKAVGGNLTFHNVNNTEYLSISASSEYGRAFLGGKLAVLFLSI